MASDNRAPIVVTITVLTMVLSCVVVFARVITRTVIRPNFGLDDASIVVTLFIFIGYGTAELVAVHHGFGRYIMELSPADAQAAVRAQAVGELFAVWTYPTGKAAVAYLLMRLFPSRTLKWILWPFVVANAIFFYLNGVFFLVQCSPVAYQWDKSIPGGTCWSHLVLLYWGYITGSVGAATDFVFAVVPWFYIARLQMTFRKKLAIGVALSMGLFPFVCSILKINYTADLGKGADPTYSTVNLVLTGEAELCAINIAACIPTLRPLYLWCKGRGARPFAPRSSAQTRRKGNYDATPERFGGRRNLTPTEVLLHSIDNRSDHKLQLRSRSEDATSQDGRTNDTSSDTV